MNPLHRVPLHSFTFARSVFILPHLYKLYLGPTLPKPRIELPEWLPDVFDYMVRNECGLKDAMTALGCEMASAQVDRMVRTREYRDRLQYVKFKHFVRLGGDPMFNQDVVVGKLLANAEKLEDEGEYDKASEVLLKIAKIRGWVGPESQVSVFGELSQRDLDALKDSLKPDQPRVAN